LPRKSAEPAQEYAFDRQRFNAVVANGAVRTSAEMTHNQYLSNIKSKIDDINTNAILRSSWRRK
jgi:hypothetical protein